MILSTQSCLPSVILVDGSTVFWALGLLYEIIYIRILGNVDLNFRCPRKHLFRERASRSNVGKFDLPMHLMGTLPCVVLAIDLDLFTVGILLQKIQ